MQFGQKRIKEDDAYDWLSRMGFLKHPNCEMMKTLSDKAVTNQSQCESQMTVRDVSGRSSHALARRRRPVTADSHAAAITRGSSSLRRLFILSHHNLAVLTLSSSRHAPSCLWRPDRRTQAALIGLDRWLRATAASGVMAEPVRPVVFTKATVCPKTHTRIHPKPRHSCQHATVSFNTGTWCTLPTPFLLFLDVSLSFHALPLLTVDLNPILLLICLSLLFSAAPLLTPPGLTITRE